MSRVSQERFALQIDPAGLLFKAPVGIQPPEVAVAGARRKFRPMRLVRIFFVLHFFVVSCSAMLYFDSRK
jgi:hypothetical protein